MTQQYRIVEPVTLHGEPAGPELANYLAFEAGDIVVLADPENDDFWETPEGVVVAKRVNEDDYFTSQELDASSLRKVKDTLTVEDLAEGDWVDEDGTGDTLSLHGDEVRRSYPSGHSVQTDDDWWIGAALNSYGPYQKVDA